MLQASGWDTRPLGYRSKWWNIVNCTGYMVFLASLHVAGGVCASGKLALADISTRSTSGPSSAGRAVVPPWDFVGSRGSKIRALDFFQSLWDWTGITAAALPSCMSDFWGDTFNIHTWSRGSGDPRDLAVGFLAAQLTRVLNNLLVHIYIYMRVCVLCIYIHIISMTLVIILHGRVWSYYQCFPVHSLNIRFLILILIIPCTAI